MGRHKTVVTPEFEEAANIEAATPLVGVIEEPVEAVVEEPKPRVPCGRLNLPCRISPAEKAEAASLMANEFGLLDATVAAKKETAARYKADEESHNANIRRYCVRLNNEFEHRLTDIEKLIDYAAGVTRVYRKDTGEVIEERPLSQSEMQTKLEMETPDAEVVEEETDDSTAEATEESGGDQNHA